jgi:hypothetical protein
MVYNIYGILYSTFFLYRVEIKNIFRIKVKV